jgi:hypothetical protein
MRAHRVFNNVHHVENEWFPQWLGGVRYQVPSMVALLCVGAAGLAALMAATWLGVVCWAVGGLVVVYLNFRINQMNPTGVLGEVTQLVLMWRAARRPYVVNSRHAR